MVSKQSFTKRRIVVRIAVSVDGFIARKDGGVDWLDRPWPKGNYGMEKFLASIDTILWGAKTYGEAAARGGAGGGGGGLGSKVKNYVFTHHPPATPVKGVEFVNGPVKDFATRLRAEPGKDIWIMGGGGIIASFLDAGEVDELVISVVPTIIGEGIPLLAPARRTVPLTLTSTTKFEDGVVSLHYAT
jgi:dihydrofolate reductase